MASTEKAASVVDTPIIDLTAEADSRKALSGLRIPNDNSSKGA